MMNRIRQTISLALVFALVSLAATAQVQRRPYRTSARRIGDLIQRLEMSSQRFSSSLSTALDRDSYQGTGTADDINANMSNFQNATAQLRDRFDRRVAVAADVENVLRQGAEINNFMANNRLNARVQSDWSLVRSDLDALANAYGVAWNWNQSNAAPLITAATPARLNERQVSQIIQRVENRTNLFRDSLDQALDRSRYDSTRAEDNVNQFMQDFQDATTRLRQRFNARQSVSTDVEDVLRRAAFINNFMQRNRLNARAQSDWSLLRTDLDSLANAYGVAWNWTTGAQPDMNAGNYGTGNYGTGNYGVAARLTGTYRLDPARSDNPRDVADRATRNLPYSSRQRVYDNLLSRLESPEMLAIDRTGSTVTIASTRAPQTTFQADGQERNEQLPNGRASRVNARLIGDQLVVSSAGYSATDFRVTFDPIEGGRSLRVTRQIWNDQLGTNPVVVQNVYTRTSDVADFNVYNGTSPLGNSTGSVSNGDFAVPNGTLLVTTLNTDLNTNQTQTGDHFTMTVREPAEFAGATIEGTVAGIDRGGRISGRSQIGLNFDTIRLRNGQTYSFAGLLESARTTNGETVQVDNEGAVRENDSRTQTTAQRAAIGTAVGAIIGAIAGGGKGAAIGAIIGAAGGAGSVYAQGRDDLVLPAGTEVTVRASAPSR